MDFQRILLIGALFLVLMMLWQAWQQDYGPQPAPPVATAPGELDLGAGDTPPTIGDVPPPATGEAQPGMSSLPSAQRIQVHTDLFHAEIDTRGGDLRRVALVQYPVEVGQPDNPVVLLDDSPQALFVAQSGLQSTSGGASPDHHTVFSVGQTEFRLRDGEETLVVPLTWQGNGLEVTKRYTFRRDSYLIDVDYEVRNGSGESWVGSMYRQFQRTQVQRDSWFIYTYTGGVIHTDQNRYEKVDFDDMAQSPLDRTTAGGWIAMIQHYFLGAWVPPADATHHIYSKGLSGDRYLLGIQGPSRTVAAGESGTFAAQLFVGPKLQDQLEAVAPALDLTVDYGMLHFIAKPIYYLLSFIHWMVGNWGWSIIILTILIKGVFYKLSETSYKSMAQLRKLQPRLASLKEKYGDDRQKMNEAMMKIYKDEKINPLGGCLPILVQIPVFIALYWVLLESVEMRQAPFILWLNDLSSADPYFVLPILMGATMLIQHRLNPTPLDPIQAKVMMTLPLVFTIFFAFFPAGLVLYWVVNNTLSITQQWYITRHVVKA